MAVQNQIVEKIEAVLCSEIEVDHKFNARSSVEISSLVGKDGADESEHNTQKTLRESISTVGQETPVVLRRMPKGSKKPYFLVSGFRRYDAVMHVAAEKGNKSPTVKAFVRDMTDQQAREENMRENTARADLSGPDLCYGIGQILKSYGKDKGPSSVALAATLGMSQGYTNQLMNIWNNCVPEIVKDWRESPNRLTAVQMYSISKEDKDKQKVKYDEMKAKKDEGTGGGRGPNAWIDTACKTAASVATILGKLQRDGACEIAGDNFFGDNIRTLVKYKADATDAQTDKICAAAEKAFTDALESEETEEDKDNAKGKSEAAKKASAKKKGGGKAATAN
jgi:ParB/RepB/Spo0J family partition protein